MSRRSPLPRMLVLAFPLAVALTCHRNTDSDDVASQDPPVLADGPSPTTDDSALNKPASPSPSSTKPTTDPASGFQLQQPLRSLRYDGELRVDAFDLQSQLIAGKPTLLLFWAPGFRLSEQTLIQWTEALAPHRDKLNVFAVSGRRQEQVVGRLWESFVLAGAPADLPLLVDDEFVVSNQMSTGDVPNVSLFAGDGELLYAKFKAPDQPLLTSSGRLTAAEIIAKVASGEALTVTRPMPHYPSQRLFGHCAPEFSLPRFDGQGRMNVNTTGKRQRPLLVLFWSSTCPHCRKEIPMLVDYQRKHPKAFDMVSITRIARDRPGRPSHRQQTREFIDGGKITWPILEDVDGAVEERYANVSLPTLFFVAPGGTTTNAWYHAPGDNFEPMLEAELAKAGTPSLCTPTTATRSPAPELSIENANGKRVSLRELIERPTIVHFWATWCKPCVEELPALLRYRDQARKAGSADVILISLDDPDDAAAKIAQFESTAGLKLNSYVRPQGDPVERIDLAYRLPRTWLVGADGELLSIREGSQPWDEDAFQQRLVARLGVGHSAR